MGAQHAACVAAFQAERVTPSKKAHAATLLDLVKPFERVPHRHLVAHPHKLGFCLRLLFLSLDTYPCPRRIRINGLVSHGLVATRGITAGSGFATVERRVLLTALIDTLRANWPRRKIQLHIDDLMIARQPRRPTPRLLLQRLSLTWLVLYVRVIAAFEDAMPHVSLHRGCFVYVYVSPGLPLLPLVSLTSSGIWLVLHAYSKCLCTLTLRCSSRVIGCRRALCHDASAIVSRGARWVLAPPLGVIALGYLLL